MTISWRLITPIKTRFNRQRPTTDCRWYLHVFSLGLRCRDNSVCKVVKLSVMPPELFWLPKYNEMHQSFNSRRRVSRCRDISCTYGMHESSASDRRASDRHYIATNGRNDLTQGRIAASHTHRSNVFARWRQCVPTDTWFVGPARVWCFWHSFHI